MKTRKILAMLMAAVLLVGASVLGTMAYLTASTDVVQNTFTVGNVALTLDEADVDMNGTPIANATRVQANDYKLMPGHSYTKDPIVHVTAGSENCYVFVEVSNSIVAIESQEKNYKNIATQMTENGWTQITGTNYYYYGDIVEQDDENDTDLPVFANFKISGTVDNATLAAYATQYVVDEDGELVLDDNDKPQPVENTSLITITAYAVQAETFTSAQAAWTATFGAPANGQ